jgi:hypothetical protein
MLKEATITQLATLVKVDPAVLKAALVATDEQDVAIPADLQVLTKTEFETRDRNKYNEGKTAATEILLKEIKTKNKIELDSNDPDRIVEAIGKKAVEEAKIAPDKQVEEAKKERDQWKAKATTAEQAQEELKKQTTQLSLDNRFRALFPKDRSDILNDDEYLNSAKGRYSIETRDGKEVVVDRTTNDIVKDKVKLEPVAPADVIKGYFTERKWITEEQKGAGGRGGKDSIPGGGAGKFAKLSEARAWVEGQGKNIQGAAGQTMLQAAIKENPDMDLSA